MSESTAGRDLVLVVLVLLAVLFILPMLFMVFGVMGMGPMMGGWNGGTWGMGDPPIWWWIVAIAMRLLMLLALVAGGYLLYRALAGRSDGRDPALEELRVAYARGDLTDEEFERRKDALREEE